jgi:hypothetical protein
MTHTEQAMSEIYRAEYVSLHVRKSNRAAIGLYRDTLGFSVHQIEKGYCEIDLLIFFLFFSDEIYARCRWGGRLRYETRVR